VVVLIGAHRGGAAAHHLSAAERAATPSLSRRATGKSRNRQVARPPRRAVAVAM